ncbi:MAG TPA: hypothetical protein VNX46_08570, partial [Candidatus Acidoferrum sp.]|nr:hypothetical protein [Candidatus Acidoferrum sp.]
MSFLALSGQAGNILVNPGFETSVFTSSAWQQHSLETWSSAAASSVNGTEPGGAPINIKLVHTGNDGLWMQGTYGNGGTSMADESVSETFACFPGNAYTADAWYSAYLFCTNHIGGDNGSLQPFYGFTPPYSPTQGGGSGLFTGSGAAAQQDGWVEVRFLDSGNNVLADYKSMIIDPAYLGVATDSGPTSATGLSYSGTLPLVTNAIGNVYLAWTDFPVTNQYNISQIAANDDPDTDIANGAVTNSLANGQMIAPPGAAKVEFSIHIYQSGNINNAGAPFWDDATLNQVAGPSPSIITPTPNGLSFFTGATNFIFNVTSASTGGAPLPTNSTSSIGFVVNGVNQTGSLQFSGPSTALVATLPGLASNSLYTISISVTNSVGLVSSKTVNFDTFPANVFVVSAEDYDYTNGQFFDNPTPTAAPAANSYFGTGGTQGVDLSTYNGGPPPSTELIRTDGRAVMQVAADTQLPLYLAQSNASVYNVQIAYNNGGNWFNYTRDYPTGNYLVFLRYNNPTAGNVESLNVLTSGYGTTTQTTNRLGEFIGANTGAGYAWVPLTDAFGNEVTVNLAAGQNTLQLLSGDGAGAGGIANFVDFILVPAGTSFAPVINNLSPHVPNNPNRNVFVNAANITFSVSSAYSTVASNNIQALVNGVDVTSGATITGNNTSWNVSLPCPQNQIVTLQINATDATGLSNRVSETFDTFSQNNFMIESVDFDFNGGQFIDSPVPTGDALNVGNEATNSYFDGGIFMTNAAVFNIDYNQTYDGEGGAQGVYRILDSGVACQPNPGDFLRSIFTNSQVVGGIATDHNLGYVNAGQWVNYTRTIPANTYNIWGRLASGGGPFANEQLALVTSGRGTTNQTTQLLGTFADANPAGWNTWHWIPMRDTNGNIASVSLGGVQTLKFTRGGNLNEHFLMFVPSIIRPVMTASISGSSVQLKFPTQSGHSYTVLYNNTLTGGSWQV